jgi:hypothetical protein
MDQPPLDDHTDFEVLPQTLLDLDGEKLVVIVKATFELRPGAPLELAEEESRRIVRPGDVPWGEPEKSSIAFPCDLCVRKPGTDVIVVGKAYAPGGIAVPSFDVAVRVGPLQKLCKVYGLRVWEAGGRGISPPRPIDEIEMRYDYAWGGADASDPKNYVEEARNPVGMGVARDPSVLTHQPAPNIEDPAYPISTCKTRPPPAGIGPIGRNWEPRRKFTGTYDDRWQKERAPLPPIDQDDRVNLCASPGLHSDIPLRGNEEVALLNLVPGGGATKFYLPGAGVEIEFHAKNRSPERFVPHLDTLIIDTLQLEPDEPIGVELVWRASIKAPRRMKDVRVIVRELEPK